MESDRPVGYCSGGGSVGGSVDRRGGGEKWCMCKDAAQPPAHPSTGSDVPPMGGGGGRVTLITVEPLGRAGVGGKTSKVRVLVGR